MVSGDILPRAYGFRPLSGSQSVATSHESQTHQMLSSSGREKETVESYRRRMVAVWRDGGFDSRRESVERRRGLCEGCDVVGIKMCRMEGDGMGWDRMGRKTTEQDVGKESSSGHGEWWA